MSLSHQSAATITPIANPEGRGEAEPRLRGLRLRLARAVWVAAATAVVWVFVAGARSELEALRVVCSDASCPDWRLTEEGARALADWGVSLDFYAAYTVALQSVFAAVCAVFGVLVFWRQSDRRMALVSAFILVTFGLTFSDTADALTLSYPAWRVPIQAVAALGVPAFFLFFYLFPDGRFVPLWTRWWLAIGLAASLVHRLFPGSPVDLLSFPPLNLSLWSGTLGTALYAQVYRYRRVSTPAQRQQTKWVVFGTVVTLAGVLTLSLALLPFPELHQPGPPAYLALNIAFTATLLCLPLSIGVAVLRYQLWDVDVVVNRTLVYGALTVGVVGLYVLVVGYLGALSRTAATC